ncbi:hypothetical protein NUW54_g162 [Trametes sanguinea]|uniref:Uncharacterized protein n=1 Tax=Trametes sanguinea TaxID=158606 RepID=A0ACC1QBS9_9APHY|nr:hypothetical protein NUW54_g162 [Trametes sanguinea]
MSFSPRSSLRNRQGSRGQSRKLICEFCGDEYSARGIHRHRVACQQRFMDAIQASQLEAELLRSSASGEPVLDEPTTPPIVSQHILSSAPYTPMPPVAHNAMSPTSTIEDDESSMGSSAPLPQPPRLSPSSSSPSSSPSSSSQSSSSRVPSPSPSPPPPPPPAAASATSASSSSMSPSPGAESEPVPDSIHIEYHPNSGIPPCTVLFEDFNHHCPPEPDPSMDHDPWFPYASRTDFEFAKFTLGASLSKKEIDTLLALICSVGEGKDKLSFHNYADLQKGWSAASSKLTPFTKHSLTVPYKKQPVSHTLYTRDVWEYIKDIICNPYLASRIEWNAHCLFQYDKQAKSWIRFIDEPLTADAAWRIQSELLKGQCPFLPIVYADKTKLSSFGSAKAYPVVMKCHNLPVEIHNGEGVGGGRVVGWLPIVCGHITSRAFADLEEKAAEKHKLGYVNYKRIIWHESFHKIFQPIRQFSHQSVWYLCGDAMQHWFCPLIAILSSDYEEQCFMSLIRGSMGLFPCPICLATKGQLCNLALHFPLRLGKEAQRILNEALSQGTQKKCEAILQTWSLRPVQNAFSELGHSDPYKALSFDRLHAFHSGLFGHHLWVKFKKYVENISNEAVKAIDIQFNAIPPWPGLKHFTEVMGLSFTDGGKYEHISKNTLFASHNIVTKTTSPAGYQLLRLLRAYLEVDMYAGLPLHTTWTIQDGRHAQTIWNGRLQKYKEFTADDADAKNWDFPKAHTHQHLFDDIEAKGVTRNYNTKPNEKLHRPLKEAYHLRTNFWDVAQQILTIDHNAYVACFMQQEVDWFDEFQKAQAEEATEDDTSKKSTTEPIGGGHFSLGAKETPRTMGDLVEAHSTDIAYRNFWQCLSHFLTQEYKAHQIPLPNGRSITFSADAYIRVLPSMSQL